MTTTFRHMCRKIRFSTSAKKSFDLKWHVKNWFNPKKKNIEKLYRMRLHRRGVIQTVRIMSWEDGEVRPKHVPRVTFFHAFSRTVKRCFYKSSFLACALFEWPLKYQEVDHAVLRILFYLWVCVWFWWLCILWMKLFLSFWNSNANFGFMF